MIEDNSPEFAQQLTNKVEEAINQYLVGEPKLFSLFGLDKDDPTLDTRGKFPNHTIENGLKAIITYTKQLSEKRLPNKPSNKHDITQTFEDAIKRAEHAYTQLIKYYAIKEQKLKELAGEQSFPSDIVVMAPQEEENKNDDEEKFYDFPNSTSNEQKSPSEQHTLDAQKEEEFFDYDQEDHANEQNNKGNESGIAEKINDSKERNEQLKHEQEFAGTDAMYKLRGQFFKYVIRAAHKLPEALQQEVLQSLFSAHKVIWDKMESDMDGIFDFIQNTPYTVFKVVIAQQDPLVAQPIIKQLKEYVNFLQYEQPDKANELFHKLLSAPNSAKKVKVMLNNDIITLATLAKIVSKNGIFTSNMPQFKQLSPSVIEQHLPTFLLDDLAKQMSPEKQIRTSACNLGYFLHLINEMQEAFSIRHKKIVKLINDGMKDNALQQQINSKDVMQDLAQKQERQLRSTVNAIEMMVSYIEQLHILQQLDATTTNIDAKGLDNYYKRIMQTIDNLLNSEDYKLVNTQLSTLKERIQLFNPQQQIAQQVLKDGTVTCKLQLLWDPRFKITDKNAEQVAQVVIALKPDKFALAVGTILNMDTRRCTVPTQTALLSRIFTNIISNKEITTSDERLEKARMLLGNETVRVKLQNAINTGVLLNNSTILADLYVSNDPTDHALLNHIITNKLYNTEIINSSMLLPLALRNNDYLLAEKLLTDQNIKINVSQVGPDGLTPLQILCMKREITQDEKNGDYTKEQIDSVVDHILSANFVIADDLKALHNKYKNSISDQRFYYAALLSAGNRHMYQLLQQKDIFGFGEEKAKKGFEEYLRELVHKTGEIGKIADLAKNFPDEFSKCLETYNPLVQMWKDGKYEGCLDVTTALLNLAPNQDATNKLLFDKIASSAPFIEHIIQDCMEHNDPIKQKYLVQILDIAEIAKNDRIISFLKKNAPDATCMIYRAIKTVQVAYPQQNAIGSIALKKLIEVSDAIQRPKHTKETEHAEDLNLLDLACLHGDLDTTKQIIFNEHNTRDHWSAKEQKQRYTELSKALVVTVESICAELKAQQQQDLQSAAHQTSSTKLTQLYEIFTSLVKSEHIDLNLTVPHNTSNNRLISYILQKEDLLLDLEMRQKLLTTITSDKRFSPLACDTQLGIHGEYVKSYSCLGQMLIVPQDANTADKRQNMQFEIFKASAEKCIKTPKNQISEAQLKQVLFAPNNLLQTMLANGSSTNFCTQVYKWSMDLLLLQNGQLTSSQKKLLSSIFTQQSESGYNLYTQCMTLNRPEAASWIVQTMVEIELNGVKNPTSQKIQDIKRRVQSILDCPANKNKNALMALASDGELAVNQFTDKLKEMQHYQNVLLNTDKFGLNVLHYAANNKNPMMFPIILRQVKSHLQSINNLNKAAQDRILSKLLNTKDKLGYTPLMQLVLNNNMNGVKEVIALKQTGLNIYLNMRDAGGNTALHHAAAFGSPEVVDALLNEPDVLSETTNNDGVTPFQFARMRSQLGQSLADAQRADKDKVIGNQDVTQWTEIQKALKNFNLDEKYSTIVSQNGQNVMNTMLHHGCSPILERDTTSLTMAFLKYIVIQVVWRTIVNVVSAVLPKIVETGLNTLTTALSAIYTKIIIKRAIKEPLLNLMSKVFEKLSIPNDVCMIGMYHIKGSIQGAVYGEQWRDVFNSAKTSYNAPKNAIYTPKDLKVVYNEKLRHVANDSVLRAKLYREMQSLAQLLQKRQHRIEQCMAALGIDPIIKRDLKRAILDVRESTEYINHTLKTEYTESLRAQYEKEDLSAAQAKVQEDNMKLALSAHELFELGQKEAEKQLKYNAEQYEHGTKAEAAKFAYNAINYSAEVISTVLSGVLHYGSYISGAKNVLTGATTVAQLAWNTGLLTLPNVAAITTAVAMYMKREAIAKSAKAAYGTVAAKVGALLEAVVGDKRLELDQIMQCIDSMHNSIDTTAQFHESNIAPEQHQANDVSVQKQFTDTKNMYEQISTQVYNMLKQAKEREQQKFTDIHDDIIRKLAAECANCSINPAIMQQIYTQHMQKTNDIQKSSSLTK